MKTDHYLDRIRKTLKYELGGADVISAITVECDQSLIKYHVDITVRHTFTIDKSMIFESNEREVMGLLISGMSKRYRAQLIGLLLRLHPTWEELGVLGSKAVNAITKAFASIEYSYLRTQEGNEVAGMSNVFDYSIKTNVWQSE